MQPIDYSTSPWGNQLKIPIEQIRVGFGMRLGAITLDWLISFIIAIFTGIVLYSLDLNISILSAAQVQDFKQLLKLLKYSSDQANLQIEFMQVFTVSVTVVSLAYSFIEASSGWSLGKRILQIRVANANGTKGNTKLYIKRWAIKDVPKLFAFLAVVPALEFLDSFGFFIQIIVFLGCFAALGVDRLALHDHIAQTAVYHNNQIQ